MTGVNISNIDALIKKNNLYLNSYNNNSKRLISSINDLSSCYGGSSLEYLFSGPMKETTNIKFISKLIKNYSDILYGVKVSYQTQDRNLKTQINNMNSNL